MPREYRPDAIEIFNTKGPDGDGFINIHMPIEMVNSLTSPAVAKRLKEAIEACEDDRNYQGWVIKDA